MRWTSEFPNGSGAYWYRDDNTEAEVRCFIGGRCYNPHDKNYYTWDQLPYECEFSDHPVQYPLEVKKERLWMNWGKEGK